MTRKNATRDKKESCVFCYYLNINVFKEKFCQYWKCYYFCKSKRHGKMAERSNAAVLKTVDLHGSGGSNPSLSAEKMLQVDKYQNLQRFFVVYESFYEPFLIQTKTPILTEEHPGFPLKIFQVYPFLA